MILRNPVICLQVHTGNVSEKHTYSIFKVEVSCPEDGETILLRNVGSIFCTCPFSHQHGGRMFLQNFGIYLEV